MTKKAYLAAVDPAAVWWHTVERGSGTLSLSKASLGEFFHAALQRNVKIGQVWPFSPTHRSLVLVTIKMTPEVRAEIEATTRFRFCEPPKIVLNSEIVDV